MKRKKIKQLKDDVLILIWNSVGEAARSGNFSVSLIREVCIGKRRTHGGYQWEYVHISDLKPKIGIKKPIKCVYEDGKQEIFPSKREAAASLGLTIQSVLNILLNRKKQNIHYKLTYK